MANPYQYDTDFSGVNYFKSPDFVSKSREDQKSILGYYADEVGAEKYEVLDAFMPAPSEEDVRWTFGSALKSGMIQNEMMDTESPEKTAFLQDQLENTARSGNLLQETVGAVFSTPLAMGVENALAVPFLSAAGPLGLGAASMLTGISSGGLQKQSLGMEIAASEYGIDTTDPEQMRELYENPELMKEINDKTRWGATAVGALDAASVGLAGKGMAPFFKKRYGGISGDAGAATFGHGNVTRAVAPAAGEFVQQGALGAGGEAASQLLTHGEITDSRGILLEGLAEGFGFGMETPFALRSEAKIARGVKSINEDMQNEMTRQGNVRSSKQFVDSEGLDRINVLSARQVVPGDKVEDEAMRKILFTKLGEVDVDTAISETGFSLEEIMDLKKQHNEVRNQMLKEQYGMTLPEATAQRAEMSLDPAWMSAKMEGNIPDAQPLLPTNSTEAAVIGVLEDRGIKWFLASRMRSEKGRQMGGLYNENEHAITLNTENKEDLFYSAAVHELIHAFNATNDISGRLTFLKRVATLASDEDRAKIDGWLESDPAYKLKSLAVREDERAAFLGQKVVKENPRAVFDFFIRGIRTGDPDTKKISRHFGDFFIDIMRKFKHLDSLTDNMVKYSDLPSALDPRTKVITDMVAGIEGDPLSWAARDAADGAAQADVLADQYEASIDKSWPAIPPPVRRAEGIDAMTDELGPKQALLEKILSDTHGLAEDDVSYHKIRRYLKKNGYSEAESVAIAAEFDKQSRSPKRIAAEEILGEKLTGISDEELTQKFINDRSPKGKKAPNVAAFKARVVQIIKESAATPQELAQERIDRAETEASDRRKHAAARVEERREAAAPMPEPVAEDGPELTIFNQMFPEHADKFDRAPTVLEVNDLVGPDKAQEYFTAISEYAEKNTENTVRAFIDMENNGGMDPAQPDSPVLYGPDMYDKSQGKKTFGEMVSFLVDEALQFASDKVPFFTLNTFDKVRTQYQDRFLAVRRLQEQAEAAGIDIETFTDVYVGEANMRGRQEHFWKLALREVIDPVNRKIDSLNLDKIQVHEFLEALHSPERNLRVWQLMKETKQPREEIGGSGLTDREAISKLRQYVDEGLLEMDLDTWAQAYGYISEDAMMEAGDHETMQKAQQRALTKWKLDGGKGSVHIMPGVDIGGKMGTVRTETKKLISLQRKLLRKYGLASRQDIKNMILTFEYYAPLRGTSDIYASDMRSVGQFLDIRGKDAQTPLGRHSRAQHDIYSQMISDVERVIIRGEKNIVGNRFYKLASKILELGDGNQMGIKEILNVTPKKWAVTEAVDIKNPSRVIQVNDMFFKNRPNVFATKIDGQVKYIVMDDKNGELLSTALKALGTEVVTPLVAFHGTLQRQLARMSTSLNPDFAVPNFIRDGLQSAAFAHAGEVEGKPGTFWDSKNLKHAARAIYDFDRSGGVSPDPAGRTPEQLYWDDRIRQLGELGGRTGWMQASDLATLQKQAEHTAVKTRVDEKTGYIIHTNPFARGVDFVETVTGVTETVFRLIAFDQALESGKMSEEKAANMARNLTVDFNKRGNSVYLSMLYIFANASIQGTTRFMKSLKNPKVRRLAMQLAGVSFGMALWNRSMMDDDEWDAIPDHMKERSLLISLGGNHLMEIPLPWGFNVFHALGTAMEGIAFGNKRPGDLVRTAGTSVISAFNPMGGTLGHSMYGSLRNFVPTVPRIAMDIAANESWTGTPIHSKYGVVGAPGHTKGREGTPVGFMWGSKALNYITGGGEVDKGFVSVYPEDIEYLLKNAFGGVGSLATNILKTGGDMASWFGDDPQELDLRNMPILRRITAQYSPEYNLDRFFKEYDKLKQITGSAEAALEAGDTDEYNRIKKKYPHYMNKQTINKFKAAEKKRRAAETIQDQGRAVKSVVQD